MTRQKKYIFHGKMKKSGDTLFWTKSSDKEKYENLLKNLEEGQFIDVFFDANVDDGTLAQLAKIHACIKEIAVDTGESVDKIKLQIKKSAGLCVKIEIEGETYIDCKSFSVCSKEELALVINEIVELGDSLGINFR
jgi:hypothetical protein